MCNAKQNLAGKHANSDKCLQDDLKQHRIWYTLRYVLTFSLDSVTNIQTRLQDPHRHASVMHCSVELNDPIDRRVPDLLHL